ncbi:hypothetical protein [Parapedobacter tibetensis]|uniref:hypothetical protein n=1 Tax=Parapedobacter tibetensis TaxID=2972951 RepID=UPI00214D8849|nr:hypothetical protein [Parapedobacter tibetensis]
MLIGSLAYGKKLSKILIALLEEGFIVENGGYFLEVLLKAQKHIGGKDFIDNTGYECFINSLHIDDYIDDDLFVQSLLFVRELSSKWREFNTEETLEIILSQTDFGFNIKFHVVRIGEEYVNKPKLNDFREAVLILQN